MGLENENKMFKLQTSLSLLTCENIFPKFVFQEETQGNKAIIKNCLEKPLEIVDLTVLRAEHCAEMYPRLAPPETDVSTVDVWSIPSSSSKTFIIPYLSP